MTGGQRLRVSSDSIFDKVFASVSNRCTRFSDSANVVRAVSISARATL